MKKELIIQRANAFVKTEKAELLPSTDGITILDKHDLFCKQTTFVPEESITKDWFHKKIHTQPLPKTAVYQTNTNALCDFLFDHIDKELLTTLDSIFFLYDPDGLQAVREHTGKEQIFETFNFEIFTGLTWFEKNIILINAQPYAGTNCPYDTHYISDSILLSLLQQLRRLMVDTNLLLSEKECSFYENEPDAIMQYAGLALKRIGETPVFVEKIQKRDA